MGDTSGQFRPGQSGNPGGRSKEHQNLIRLARKHCRKALLLCQAYVEDERAAPSIRLAAAGMLLDRGLGKAAPLPPLSTMSDEELVRELLLRKQVRDADELRNRLGTAASDDEEPKQ